MASEKKKKENNKLRGDRQNWTRMFSLFPPPWFHTSINFQFIFQFCTPFPPPPAISFLLPLPKFPVSSSSSSFFFYCSEYNKKIFHVPFSSLQPLRICIFPPLFIFLRYRFCHLRNFLSLIFSRHFFLNFIAHVWKKNECFLSKFKKDQGT